MKRSCIRNRKLHLRRFFFCSRHTALFTSRGCTVVRSLRYALTSLLSNDFPYCPISVKRGCLVHWHALREMRSHRESATYWTWFPTQCSHVYIGKTSLLRSFLSVYGKRNLSLILKPDNTTVTESKKKGNVIKDATQHASRHSPNIEA